MHNFTALWGWPQWFITIYLILSLSYVAIHDGEDKIYTAGNNKGKPIKYNAFLTFTRLIVVVGILIAGGFYR